MQTFTAEQIEARALELFNERKANRARRDRWSADAMRFEGKEREFCMASAKTRLEQEAYDAAQAEAEIARWSRVSTPALKAMIDDLERRRSHPDYTLAVRTVEQDADRSDYYRMRAEYTRRLGLKITADDVATDAAMADSAVRLADMRTPIMQAAE